MFNEDPNLPCSHAERQQRASNGGDGRKNGRSGATVTFARMGRQRLHALIVDDEEPARENLRLMLEDHCPGVEVVGVADGPATARERIGALDPDLLFLDIRMPSGTEGLDLLAELPDLRALVIFVTAFKDYALQAFHTHAVDYLLKPIDVQALDQALARVAERLRQPGARGEGRTGHRVWWEVPTATGFTRVRVQDIVVASAEGSYTLLHLAGQPRPMTISRALGEVEKELGPGFLRTHRSHLVNPAHVRGYIRPDGERLHLSNGSTVPIARDRVQEVLQRLREEG